MGDTLVQKIFSTPVQLNASASADFTAGRELFADAYKMALKSSGHLEKAGEGVAEAATGTWNIVKGTGYSLKDGLETVGWLALAVPAEIGAAGDPCLRKVHGTGKVGLMATHHVLESSAGKRRVAEELAAREEGGPTEVYLRKLRAGELRPGEISLARKLGSREGAEAKKHRVTE